MSASAMTADLKVAVDFLQSLRPDGPWVLTAITPDGPIETITARNEMDVCSFVRKHDGKRNIYYSVNPTRTAMTSKAASVRAHNSSTAGALSHIEKVIVDGIRHGFFDYSITCEITSGGNRRVCVRSGKSYMFTIPEDEISR